MAEAIDLDFIDPNPYQPREREDPEHVANVANSIALRGLMQIPLGRLVMDGELLGLPPDIDAELADGARVQLAFGHTRLAAYKLLRSQREGVMETSPWYRMPVELRELSDVEMFEYGIQENLARKDLTALEEARAMQRYKDDFGKTSAEIGELFGLSDSAVRNKLRLLKLPEDVQKQVTAAQVPEGVARGLVSLFDMPETIRQTAEERGKNGGHWTGYGYISITPSDLVRESLAGEINAEQLQERTKRILEAYTKDLNKAIWPLDWEREHPEFESTSCKKCPLRMKDRNLCPSVECYEAKRKTWQDDHLYLASQASGIKVQGEDEEYSAYGHHNWRYHVATIKQTGCENLRLRYDGHPQEYEKDYHLHELGYPNAEIFCSKRAGYCTCLKGLAAIKKQDGDLPEETELQAEDLEAAAKEERRRVLEVRRRSNDLRDEAREILVELLEQKDFRVFCWLARQAWWQSENYFEDPEKLYEFIAGELAGSPGNYTGDRYAEWLRETFEKYDISFPEEVLAGVSAETAGE